MHTPIPCHFNRHVSAATACLLGIFLFGGLGHSWAADDPGAPGPATTPPSASPSSGTADTGAPPAPDRGRHKGGHPLRQACGEELKKFCKDVKPGEGRLKQCLEGHKQELAPTCQSMLDKQGARKRN